MARLAHWNQGPQWGDERRFTLKDLMVRLRMAFSEPHSGAWGTVVYDVDKDFNANITEFDLTSVQTPDPDKYAVNELALMLNDAQVYVVTDLYDRGYAFPEVDHRIPVYRGMTEAILPGDFMAMESVFHVCGTYRCRVDEASVKELQDSYPYGTSYSSERAFCYYEVRGNAGLEVASGQIPHGDVLDYDDALKVPLSATEKIAVGDYVLNETDGSSARIMSFDAPEGDKVVLQLSELMGGRSDTFESLDFYSIQSAAQPFEKLNLWPRLKYVREECIYKGEPLGWVLNEYRTPTRMTFQIDALPEGLGNPRLARVLVAIREDATPDADPTFELVASGALTSEIQAGVNDVNLLIERDFVPEKQYYVTITTNNYNPDTGAGVRLEPRRIELYEAEKDNYLKTRYTRLPNPMLTPDALCELPPYLVPAQLEYAKLMGYAKKTGKPDIDESMLGAYEMQISKRLSFLRKRGESGPGNIFTTPRGPGRRFTRSGFLIPPGYTDDVRF